MAPDEKDDEDIFDLSDSFDEGDDDDVIELTDVVDGEAEEGAAPAEDLSLGDEGGEDFDQELDDLFGDDEGGDASASAAPAAPTAPAEPAEESDDGGFEMGFDEDDGGLDFDAEMNEAQDSSQPDVPDSGGDEELDFSALEDDAGGEPVADLEQGEDEDIPLDFGEEETAEVEGLPDDDDLGDLEPEMDLPDLPDEEGDELSAADDDDDDLDSAIADMSGLDDLVDEMDFPQAATKGVPAEKARAPKAAPAPPAEEILEAPEDAAFDMDDFAEEAPEAPAEAPADVPADAPADVPADVPAEAPVEDVFEEEAPEPEMVGDDALPDVEDLMAGVDDEEDVLAEVPEPEAEFPEPEMEQPEMAEAEEAGAAWDMGGEDDALPDVGEMAAGMGESLAESDAMDMDMDMGGAEPVADMVQDQDGELPDVQELMAGLEDEGSPTAEYINPATPVEDLGEEAETAWDEAPVATHQDLEGIYDRLSALEEQAQNPSGGLSIEELDLRIEEALTEDSELFQRIKDAIAFELKGVLDSALKEHLEPLKEKLMAGSVDSEARLRLKALEDNFFSHKEWNIFSLQLKEEIMSQVGKTMPQAAARVLREEIAAMVKDMG